MKMRLFTGVVGAAMLLAPLIAADSPKAKSDTHNQRQDSDMQRAIAFEHYKDLAAARQARREEKHPSVSYNNADRSVDQADPGPGRQLVKPKK
ncbi:MAG TPA: hypothetical protein VG456_17970 [Candidatus Sulfopaludibacter sp.]|jgi:hypothetical protein|nr:hypothetical protein [Candidatus Sulfopaludibacter sp.]